MKKENKTFRLKPELVFAAKQAADHHGRTLTNLIEYLLAQEIKRLKGDGVQFEKFVPPGGEVIGKGADPELKKAHEDFVNNR